ncbi:MAG: hypothetical protein ACLPY1_07070 [Terracidiphilus sp.]
MRKHRFAKKVMAGAALALAFAITASASVNRTFVSTTGNDANVSVNCSASASCRTFAAALSVTNAGGEIVVVDSGGYGPATISQPVTITATGIDASVTQTGVGDDALTINTTGNVTLNGLSLYGGGTGLAGILVSQVGFLRLYNVGVYGFEGLGIDFAATSGSLAIYNSKINDCDIGLLMEASGGRAYVNGSEFDDDAAAGVDATQGKVDVADSDAHYSGVGFLADGGTVALFNVRVIYNTVGLAVSGTSDPQGAGQMYGADSLLADNTDAWAVDKGGVLTGSNPGTSLIAPGQGSSTVTVAGQVLQ